MQDNDGFSTLKRHDWYIKMHDRLLEWCSERETGTISTFREVHDWLAASESIESQAGLALYWMQTLGHLEADWSTKRWAIAPPVITALDDSGGNALLIGARPRWLMREIATMQDSPNDELAEIALRVIALDPHEQHGAPSVRYLTGPRDDTLERLAQVLGIRFEHRVSQRLMHMIPAIDSCLDAGKGARTPVGVGVQRLMPDSSSRWQDVDDDRAPGTYQYESYGAPRYQYNDGTRRFETDKATAIFAELRRTQTHVLFYSPKFKEMYVPGWSPLPLLAARCAVLRTGLVPPSTSRGIDGVPESLGRINRFQNIPFTLYYAICKAVGQKPQSTMETTT